jgi:glycosyltransferase involved in cell wall biosynthesis
MRTENDPADPPSAALPFVSVVIATYNRRLELEACIGSLSRLCYPRFETLICVDSGSEVSSDEVRAMAASCEHIRVLACDGAHGASATRNTGIAAARGELVFFTDDDVLVTPDWLARGVSHFVDDAVVGIEGRIVYVRDGYRQRYGDRVVENPTGGLYMTANAGYRSQTLQAAKPFDERFRRMQDRELAHRLRGLGKVVYAEDCVVFHQHDRYTVRSFMSEAKRVREMLALIKQTGDQTPLVGRIYAPSKLAAIVFPPVILLRLLSRRMSSRDDVLLFLLSYPRLCYERLLLWRTALAERFFVL